MRIVIDKIWCMLYYKNTNFVREIAMKDTFLNIIRTPDDIKIQTEKSPFRFEEKGEKNDTHAEVKCDIVDDVLNINLYPNGDAVKYVRLRFDGDISDVKSILGDSLVRSQTDDVVWHSFLPHQEMPWYFYTNDGEFLHSYGVKCGCNSFAFWFADAFGITLLLDVRNGSGGINCEKLLCAQVVCRKGISGENMYKAAHEFCKKMCDKPNLPKTAVYGLNNWYWAYGAIEEKVVLQEAEYLGKLTKGFKNRPFMTIDDGWQIAHAKGKYNGGPWNLSNENFNSMQATAEKIHGFDCRAGIWVRLLLTMSHLPNEAVYDSPYKPTGIVMDPTHEFSKQKIYDDVKMLSSWGYDMIKHDFSFFDLFGATLSNKMPNHFYDKTKTNAQIVKDFYTLIQQAAGNTLVMGCNTVNHLAAGIHQIQRSGNDTSGRHFEFTRRYGVHSMMRAPQNNAFFKTDPDCAAFTEKVSKKLNFNFLEMAAITGSATFASVTPGILNTAEEKQLQQIFEIADTIKPENYATICDWANTAVPSKFEYDGKNYNYNWYEDYKGSRNFVSWFE